MEQEALAARLRTLAAKYERPEFLRDDPSQFMHRFAAPADQELFAFVAAQLAFGRREQFILKLNQIYGDVCQNCGGLFCQWLLSGGHKTFFPNSQKKFYRFFSYADLRSLCGRLARIVQESGSLGEAVRREYERAQDGSENFGKAKNAASPGLEEKRAAESGGLPKNCGRSKSAALFGREENSGKTKNAAPFRPAKNIPRELRLVSALIRLFPGERCVSQNPRGACKRLHMFLRWMVRQKSPVDLGLWDWTSAADLLIPLDTHVLQESARLGLVAPNAAASAKTAIFLTKKMEAAFPGDPARADFALFGLGVDAAADF